MQTSEKLTLKMAENIAEAVLSYARKQDMMPLTVAILDRGGHLVTFLREDDSSIMRPDIAIGKAWGSLGMGVNTRLLRDRLADRPAFQNALSVASSGRFIPVPGGVLIKNQLDKILGDAQKLIGVTPFSAHQVRLPRKVESLGKNASHFRRKSTIPSAIIMSL